MEHQSDDIGISGQPVKQRDLKVNGQQCILVVLTEVDVTNGPIMHALEGNN